MGQYGFRGCLGSDTKWEIIPGMLAVFMVSFEIPGVYIVANNCDFFGIARCLSGIFHRHTGIPFLHLCSNYLPAVPVPGKNFRFFWGGFFCLIQLVPGNLIVGFEIPDLYCCQLTCFYPGYRFLLIFCLCILWSFSTVQILYLHVFTINIRIRHCLLESNLVLSFRVAWNLYIGVFPVVIFACMNLFIY